MDPLLQFLHQKPDPAWTWRFDAARHDWSPQNALALANCALLAYRDAAEAQATFKGWGFLDASAALPAGPTQALVAWRPECIVVTLRGTRPTKLQDYVTDIDYAQDAVDMFPWKNGGAVHRGILSRWDKVQADVVRLINQANAHLGGARPLFFCGHSLGGALAMVGASRLYADFGGHIAGIHTIGQPRAGNPAFCKAYDAALGAVTFRCVNDADLVPHLPPVVLPPTDVTLLLSPGGWPSYAHCGQLRRLLPGGGVSSAPNSDVGLFNLLEHVPTEYIARLARLG